ncbi:sugar phosphate isomerase/epimerase [Paenibacillus sp. IB182493]|uniref:Sugar phosphate isomerase/epimerase n=1 Tax=Paenibacillus arenilitoris TaxID=2772299 RepID=A0A927CR92_9BACL|nr:sugar phosphate isomerase/epimerase family protein [Paenibacillus arenilitoris]MBD2870175.1 sugar phosphate isomerase/epimerase [Paenibacillus arenilitoris]
MNVSLSMWSVHKYWYDGTWDTVDFLGFAAEAGASGVELLSCFWKDKERDIPRIDEALARYGLKVACFCACNNFIAADEREREAQVKEVTDAVDAAVHFGAKVVRVFSGDVHGDSISYEQGLAYVIDGLSRAAEYAERKGVVLCLENHGLFAGRSDQVNAIIEQVGSNALRSTFDTGNFLLVGQSPRDAVDELKHFAQHVHVKDFAKAEEGTRGAVIRGLTGELFLGKIAGEGEVDLAYIFSKLKEAGYGGWLSVEFEGDEEPKLGSLKALAHVEKLVAAL